MYIIGVDCAVSDEKTGLAQINIQNPKIKLLKVEKGSKKQSSLIIIENELIGSGKDVIQLTQFFGGAFGVALTGLLLDEQIGESPNMKYRNNYLVLAGLLA